MRVTLGRALIVTLVIGVVGLIISALTSAPHGQKDPAIADVGYLMLFASVPVAVVLLLTMGVRAGRNRGRTAS